MERGKDMRISHRGIAITALAVIAVLFAGAALAERKLSGSELLRAERCAGLYDCDEDGPWATEDGAVPSLTVAEGAVRLPQECAEPDAARRGLPADVDHRGASD